MERNVELAANKIILDILEDFDKIDKNSRIIARYIAMHTINKRIEQLKPIDYNHDPTAHSYYYFLIKLFAFIEKNTPPMYYCPKKKAGVSSFFNY